MVQHGLYKILKSLILKNNTLKFVNICNIIPDHMKIILVSRIECSIIRLINMSCCMKERVIHGSIM